MMPKPDTAEILEYFLQEAEDYINTLERGISQLRTTPNGDVLIEELFRAAHTLKGSAAIARLTETTKIAHRMEDILEELKDKKIFPTRGIVDILRFMLNTIKRLVQNISENKKEDAGVYEEIIKIVNETLLKEKSKTPIEPLEDIEKPIVQTRKEVSLSGNHIKIDINTIVEMTDLIENALSQKNSFIKNTKDIGLTLDVLSANKDIITKTITELPSILEKKPDIYISIEKLKKATTDMSEAYEYLNEFIKYLIRSAEEMEKTLEILKSLVHDMRMTEADRFFQRFIKSVKEIASQNNKKVEVVVKGGQIKIDRVIIDRLFAPLTHIARNSIIHGIESPEERIKSGKTAEGLITISVKGKDNLIEIEISDDGRGIDTNIIRKTAIKKGILNPDDNPSKDKLISLIFEPGFTTAEISDISSGRGIGLSAARKQIADMNGTIEVFSEEGCGTTFKISIPSSMISLT